MGNKIAAAALQYSKKLSQFICWAWALYRFFVLLVAAIQPSVAAAIGETIPGIDMIMMINISCYLVNSLGEKWLYSDRMVLRWIDKGGFKHLLGRIASGLLKDVNTDSSTEESEDEESEEEDEDGGDEDADTCG